MIKGILTCWFKKNNNQNYKEAAFKRHYIHTVGFGMKISYKVFVFLMYAYFICLQAYEINRLENDHHDWQQVKK